MSFPDLPQGYDRHRAALDIVDPGACNPSGVALAIHNACRQAIAEGADQRTDPAIRLMVTQLAFLTDANSDLDLAEYQRLLEACRGRVASPDNQPAPDAAA